MPQRPGGAHRKGRRAPCIRVEHPFLDGLGLCRRRSPCVRLEHPALRGRGRLLRLACECRHLRLLRLGECRHPGHSRLGLIRLHGFLHLRCRLGRLRSRPIHRGTEPNRATGSLQRCAGATSSAFSLAAIGSGGYFLKLRSSRVSSREHSVFTVSSCLWEQVRE